MASIADILIAKGNAAAQGAVQRGNIYADLIRNLSSVPGQVIQQQRQLEQDQMQRQLLQAKLSMLPGEQQLQQQQLQQGQMALQASQRDLDAEHLAGLLPRDPNTGDLDVTKIGDIAAQSSPEVRLHAETTARKLNASNAALREQALKYQMALDDARGEIGLQLRQNPNDLGAFQMAVSEGVRQGLVGKDEAPTLLKNAVEQPDFIGQQADRWIAKSKEARAAAADKIYTAKKDETPFLQHTGPGGTLTLTPIPGLNLPKSAPTPEEDKQALRDAYGAEDLWKKGRGRPPTAAQQKLIDDDRAMKAADEAAKPKSYQKSPVLLDGKRAEVFTDPASGKVYDLNMQPIENAAARITSIPPVAVTINDQRRSALDNIPDWARDESRPSGPGANVVDKTIGRTPNGLWQDVVTYMQTGRNPAMGRGSDPQTLALRTAIDSKAGALAASLGVDIPTLQALWKANAGSLSKMQTQSDQAQAAIATADRNAALLEQALKKMPDTGSPFLNQPLRAFATRVQGDPNMAPIATYLASVQNEYGKLITSSTGAAAALTDSARREAQNLIDPNASVASMLNSIRALNAEGQNRILSSTEQIQKILGRMQVAPSTTPPPGGGVKVLSITPVK